MNVFYINGNFEIIKQTFVQRRDCCCVALLYTYNAGQQNHSAIEKCFFTSCIYT